MPITPFHQSAWYAMTLENFTEVIEEFKVLLTDAIKDTYDPSTVTGLLFSGGLDSSILADMLKKVHSSTLHLFVSGSESAVDIEQARVVAETLTLPLIIRQFTLDDVKEILLDVLSVVTVVDVLHVELAIPLYLATKCAHQFDVTVLFSGQGADELFGGYAKHERQFIKSGEEAARLEMECDLQRLQNTTLPCQQAIVNHFRLEYRTPFLSDSIVQFTLALPFNAKLISTSDGVIRKRFLRLLADNLGLPEEVVNAPKRAMQYGSGTHRLLCDLSQEFWTKKDSSISLRQARSHARIQEYLNQLKHQTPNSRK
jgi:asparagine synthase (glutamine-hydrolysing)